MKSLFICMLLLLCASCSRHYLSIYAQKVDREYLASSKVGTPDPRQIDPPIGEMLTLYWHVPGTILAKSPHVKLHVIYWDYTEGTFTYPIDHRFGYVNYRLLGDEFYNKKGILTYRAEILTNDNTVYKEWKHQLWVNLITLKEI